MNSASRSLITIPVARRKKRSNVGVLVRRRMWGFCRGDGVNSGHKGGWKKCETSLVLGGSKNWWRSRRSAQAVCEADEDEHLILMTMRKVIARGENLGGEQSRFSSPIFSSKREEAESNEKLV